MMKVRRAGGNVAQVAVLEQRVTGLKNTGNPAVVDAAITDDVVVIGVTKSFESMRVLAITEPGPSSTILLTGIRLDR
ncbi:hypothetical protein ACMHYB_38655 [Sorangium sp. So ce1128]